MSSGLSLPEPSRRHLADRIHVADIAAQADQLHPDGRPFLDHVSCAIRILWRRRVRVVSHVGWQVLDRSARLEGDRTSWRHTSLETKTVRGPASQKTPCGLMEETAQSICRHHGEPCLPRVVGHLPFRP